MAREEETECKELLQQFKLKKSKNQIINEPELEILEFKAKSLQEKMRDETAANAFEFLADYDEKRIPLY